MKWLAIGLIVAGVGNAIYLPLHLVQPSESSLPLAAAASVFGLFALATGIGTWARRIYGWRMGFVTIFAGCFWCAFAGWESIALEPGVASKIIASVVAVTSLLLSLLFSDWWRGRRSWFKPLPKS